MADELGGMGLVGSVLHLGVCAYSAGMTSYVPDDSRISSASLEYLMTAEGCALRAAVAALPDPGAASVSDVAGLRKKFPREALHAALTLGVLQGKGVRKFSGVPYVFAVPEALEQATSYEVARHKAGRFVGRAGAGIVDLCAGIGGDALALAEVAPVTAVDLSEARLTCLRLNAASQVPRARFAIETVVGDVQKVFSGFPKGALFHIDPARRHDGKRSACYADLIPGPEVLEGIMVHFAGGAVKLSPAVDFESLPGGLPTHLELISHHRSVVQAVLYTGTVAEAFVAGTRTATVMTNAGAWSYTAAPGVVTLAANPLAMGVLSEMVASGATLYELDGAVTRASLAAAFAGEHGLVPLTSDGGYLVSAESGLAGKLPCLTPFRIISVVAYSEGRVVEELRRLKGIDGGIAHGPVEVKSRGHLRGIDNDSLQIVFSKATPNAMTVLIFRHGDATYAAVAARP